MPTTLLLKLAQAANALWRKCLESNIPPQCPSDEELTRVFEEVREQHENESHTER